MNVGQIIRVRLTAMGADGLCNPAQECGCGLDNLAPCESLNLSDCVHARRVSCRVCRVPVERRPGVCPEDTGEVTRDSGCYQPMEVK